MLEKPRDITLDEILDDLAEGEAPDWAEKIVRDRLVEAIDEDLDWLVGRFLFLDKDAVWERFRCAFASACEDLERELREENIARAGDYIEAVRDAEGWI